MSEKSRNILEWAGCVVIALVITLLFRYYVVTPTVVKQESMYPTLIENQRLIVTRTFRITGKVPEVGDIVTFEAPTYRYSSSNADQSNPVAIYTEEDRNIIDNFLYNIIEVTKKSYIKRVIAAEGDHVEIKDGVVFVNGIQLQEKYLQSDVVTESNVFYDFIVPEGYMFCMGDNRTKSIDCRELGCIPVEKIEGIVVFRFWPFDVAGNVD